MKTATFIWYVARALLDITGDAHEARTVPFDPDPTNPEIEVDECLGFVIGDPNIMPQVAARACHFIFENEFPDDVDEALGDFTDLMGHMKIATFMNWHCAYFPGLTQAQVDFVEVDEPTIAQRVIGELISQASIERVDLTHCTEYVATHVADIEAYFNNGMSILEIVDTVRSMPALTEGGTR